MCKAKHVKVEKREAKKNIDHRNIETPKEREQRQRLNCRYSEGLNKSPANVKGFTRRGPQ